MKCSRKFWIRTNLTSQSENHGIIPWKGEVLFSGTRPHITSRLQNSFKLKFSIGSSILKFIKLSSKRHIMFPFKNHLKSASKLRKNEKSPAIQPLSQNFNKKFKENCTQKDCCAREISTLTQINFFLSFLALKKMKYHVLRNKQQFNYITWIFHIIYFYIFLLFLQFYLYTHLVIIDKRRKAKKTLARKTNNFTYISHKFR